MSTTGIASEEIPTFDPIAENEKLHAMRPSERIRWALDTFGERLVLSTSFGVQAAVMLHLVTREAPKIPVIFIDTGYLFPETYRFAETLSAQLALNLHIYSPRITAARQEALYGKRWEQGKEGLAAYGLLNKVEPMNRALHELGALAWMSGLRRAQSRTREDLPLLSLQKKTWKLHPILEWSDRDIYHYMQQHDLPYHPLWEKGYVSIGDWHSTKPLSPDTPAEQTRFNGLKRECGLHELSGQGDWQI